MNRKISTSVAVKIYVGKYQNIQISKYGEEEISYSSEEERIEKEDKLNDELVGDLIRNMRKLPEKLGKKTEAVFEVEESIKKAIPDWMQSNIEPNLASENHEAVQGEQKQSSMDAKVEEDSAPEFAIVEPPITPTVEQIVSTAHEPEEALSEVTDPTTDPTPEPVTVAADDSDDFLDFDDSDLFEK